MADLLSRLDWPNLLGGVVLSAVGVFLAWLIKSLYEYYALAKDLPYRIWGKWYSAEFDIKGSLERSQRNTFLEVRMRPGLLGGVVVKAIRAFNVAPNRVKTEWKVHGKIVQGDTLVGTWRSTVRNTNRHGTVLLKLADYGRSVGYWTGYGSEGNPGYGYWIMARDKQDLRELATAVLNETEFDWTDVVGFILKYPPPAAPSS